MQSSNVTVSTASIRRCASAIASGLFPTAFSIRCSAILSSWAGVSFVWIDLHQVGLFDASTIVFRIIEEIWTLSAATTGTSAPLAARNPDREHVFAARGAAGVSQKKTRTSV